MFDRLCEAYMALFRFSGHWLFVQFHFSNHLLSHCYIMALLDKVICEHVNILAFIINT